MTQSELAERVGRSRATITNIENGHALTTLPLLIELATVLDVSVDWLVSGTITETPGELLLQLRQIRARWQNVLDGNRGLGWPEQAELVQMPRDFVRDLDALLGAVTSLSIVERS